MNKNALPRRRRDDPRNEITTGKDGEKLSLSVSTDDDDDEL